MRLVTAAAVPVLQACGGSDSEGSLLSRWMERQGANHLLMDVTFGQEAEPDGQPRPLRIYLYTSDTPMSRFLASSPVAELWSEQPFPQSAQQVSGYLSRRAGLDLGPLRGRGFQLAFAYGGTCALLTSVRLYYRKCPDIVEGLASYRATAAGSPVVAGSCVAGAAAVSPPLRECDAEGSWGPASGRCSCRPGHRLQDAGCRGGWMSPAPC